MMKSHKLLSSMAFSVLVTLSANSTAKEISTPQVQERAYVETSYLIAPRRVGDFTLEGVQYDKSLKYSGAGFRYVLDGHQETRIDVYVYPAGKMSQGTAMSQGMAAFRADLGRAVDAKSYTNLSMQDEQEFLLASPPQPSNPQSLADLNAAELMSAVATATHPAGRKVQMTMNLQPHELPMYSSGHLFYKQLYYFKVRASAAQERIDEKQFDALADLAARTLVPAIEVANVGDCANSVIHLSTNATPEEAASALVSQSTLHRGYNCHTTAEHAGIDKEPEDFAIVDISYEPREWKSE